MSYKTNKRIDNSEPLKIWIWSLIVIFFLSIFSYGYFVRVAIVNIVTRQNVEKEISVLSSKVIDLESNYIKTKNSITPELALNLGFVASTNQKFVTKDTKNPGLSLVTPGI